MKTIASNDSLEFLRITHDEDPERIRFMHHNLDILDQRADWTMRLIQSWGHAAAMGDIISKYMTCDEHAPLIPPKQVPPEEMVMRICEVVDAAWNEMQHRGWIVKTGSIGDE